MNHQIEAMGKTLTVLREIGLRHQQRLVDETTEKMEKAQGLEELIKFSNLRFDIASLHIHDFCYQTMPMYRMITDDIEERMHPRFDRQTSPSQ